MFKCKSCPCKDEHIASLKKEIEFLKRLALPMPSLPSVNLDENYLLNGAASERAPEPIDPEEQERLEQAAREEARILSGNYDNY